METIDVELFLKHALIGGVLGTLMGFLLFKGVGPQNAEDRKGKEAVLIAGSGVIGAIVSGFQAAPQP